MTMSKSSSIVAGEGKGMLRSPSAQSNRGLAASTKAGTIRAASNPAPVKAAAKPVAPMTKTARTVSASSGKVLSRADSGLNRKSGVFDAPVAATIVITAPSEEVLDSKHEVCGDWFF